MAHRRCDAIAPLHRKHPVHQRQTPHICFHRCDKSSITSHYRSNPSSTNYVILSADAINRTLCNRQIPLAFDPALLSSADAMSHQCFDSRPLHFSDAMIALYPPSPSLPHFFIFLPSIGLPPIGLAHRSSQFLSPKGPALSASDFAIVILGPPQLLRSF